MHCEEYYCQHWHIVLDNFKNLMIDIENDSNIDLFAMFGRALHC